MPATFTVTYEIVTPESTELGDYLELGCVKTGVPVREPLEEVWSTRTSQVDGILCVEADNSEWTEARWVTVHNGMEYLTGAYESRSIHFPAHLTGATRKRLVRVVRGMHV